MNRRIFIGSGLVGLLGEAIAQPRLCRHFQQPQQPCQSNYSTIKIDDVTFLWRHTDGTLQCQVSAPTQGWFAAGFNDSEGLDKAWIVIGHVTEPITRVEEHIATPPTHRTVQSLGLQPAIIEFSGLYSAGYSVLNFTVLHKINGRPELDLKRGNSLYLMLAWSYESDFEHHCAWRKHIAIIL